ncbi:HoxN/HupN/NixA family nickel/cobalt transporter [uncultured Salinisphaera sp.]|uniref:HoxN/HupN/NixA family nickel/cobalt transporter n=1 Tax=uncultured Salinisphaera sp. TaxID=359372 RepID=UPI0032B2C6CF
MNDAQNAPSSPRLIAAIVGLHLVGLGLLLAGAAEGTLLFGLGGLAYLLGLRHAFDIDHIAVIDNVSRKLVRERRSAAFVGFAFSAGHSSVVFLLCLLVVLTSGALAGELEGIAAFGGVFGTVVSATFLSVMAALNARLVWRLWQGYRHAECRHDARARGLLSRMVTKSTAWIDRGWKMYPLGFVFGLGFDTATEVALLGLSAGAAQHAGWPPWSVMALPVLFAAGMTSLDSVNGWLMQRAYRWGTDSPKRLRFNLAITMLSVAVAGLVAAMEWTGLALDHLAPGSWLGDQIAALPSAALGVAVVAACLLLWALARYRGARRPIS